MEGLQKFWKPLTRAGKRARPSAISRRSGAQLRAGNPKKGPDQEGAHEGTGKKAGAYKAEASMWSIIGPGVRHFSSSSETVRVVRSEEGGPGVPVT